MSRLIPLLAISLLASALAVSVVLRADESPRADKPSGTPAPAVVPVKDLPLFTVLDVNGDTSISAKEARAHAGLAAIFAECDADRNGALSTWEFAEARSKLAQ
jgi:hypothetical protein